MQIKTIINEPITTVKEVDDVLSFLENWERDYISFEIDWWKLEIDSNEDSFWKYTFFITYKKTSEHMKFDKMIEFVKKLLSSNKK